MNALNWLMTANAVLWLGLGLYLARLALVQRRLERRIHQEENHD